MRITTSLLRNLPQKRSNAHTLKVSIYVLMATDSLRMRSELTDLYIQANRYHVGNRWIHRLPTVWDVSWDQYIPGIEITELLQDPGYLLRKFRDDRQGKIPISITGIFPCLSLLVDQHRALVDTDFGDSA